MKITYYHSLEEIKTSGNYPLLYLVTETIDMAELRAKVQQPFYGAIVPHIIANNQLYHDGILEISFDDHDNVTFYLLDMKKRPNVQFKPNSTLMMFSDLLNSFFEPFLEQLGRLLTTQTIFGSGVGGRSLTPIPSIFDQNQSYQCYSLIVEIKAPIYVGVKHGWKPLYGPLVVTKSKDNIIYELNNEPAFEVYAKVLRDIDDQEITVDNFFDIAKAYPFGILSYTRNEFIVRDPLQPTDEQALLMVSSIEPNETVYIMKGDHTGLIEAAVDNARLTLSPHPSHIHLLFDCISRVLYMGDDFIKEIEAIAAETSGMKPIFGITSIGEITNEGFSSIKIFNKTNLLGSIDHAPGND
jgi:hypothetical protein